MRNIKLTLEYDGTAYAGWQAQANALAIQDVVRRAVEQMTEEKVKLLGASRTDAGVHALGQVASFQTSREIPCGGFLKGLNSLLPEDIRVKSCEEVALDFHPIRDAKQKTYRYLFDTENIPSALERNRAWWVGPGLDWQAMETASRCLAGEHDFKSFVAAGGEVKTTVRRLEEVGFAKDQITFTGNGFLKQMVRNIVGTLVAIGRDNKCQAPTVMQDILGAKDRTQAGPTAPPQGLYLVGVEY
ncbi:MAG: tRNA pseudouridine(38-40) synthase TruA [Deltaproteobacteria bacterium]|nr:tRNA pseudouridine(38-40) synthase TruA [Deltaproteobacteria bacterium]MBI4223984.1 tRNA pseudouridine(38-40) synthase TruA [Deltaproteobacteria bacterium]